MADHDDVPYIVIERRSGAAGPFLWGLLLGAGAALLLAPRSGPQTQEEIRTRARRVRDLAEERANRARDSVTGAVSRTRNQIVDRLDSVRDALEVRAEQARDALDAGRRAAMDARAELERRVARAKGTAEPDGTAAPPPPPGEIDVVVTEVVVEEVEGRPGLD
jgi:gas vesicle protein